MAGFPPLTGPGGQPQQPLPGGPGMPVRPAPPMIPPQAQPPAPPPAPPGSGGGMGSASVLAGMLSDLDAHMGPGWQQLDLASRCLASALRSTDFQQTPAIVAVIQSQNFVLKELLSKRTGTNGSATSGGAIPSLPNNSEGSLASIDADAQPSADSDEGGD